MSFLQMIAIGIACIIAATIARRIVLSILRINDAPKLRISIEINKTHICMSHDYKEICDMNVIVNNNIHYLIKSVTNPTLEIPLTDIFRELTTNSLSYPAISSIRLSAIADGRPVSLHYIYSKG